jgi:hypothetical protein
MVGESCAAAVQRSPCDCARGELLMDLSILGLTTRRIPRQVRAALARIRHPAIAPPRVQASAREPGATPLWRAYRHAAPVIFLRLQRGGGARGGYSPNCQQVLVAPIKLSTPLSSAPDGYENANW